MRRMLVRCPGCTLAVTLTLVSSGNGGITLDLNSHATRRMQRSATDALDALLSGG